MAEHYIAWPIIYAPPGMWLRYFSWIGIDSTRPAWQIVGPGLKFWHHAHPNFICQRKMMSALVLSCRTNTPSRVIDEA